MSKLDGVQSFAKEKNGRQQAKTVWFCFRLHKPSSNLTFSTWKQITERKINERFHLEVFWGNIYPIYMQLSHNLFFLIKSCHNVRHGEARRQAFVSSAVLFGYV